MSAVNPARLNEQIEELASVFADPIALRRKCVDMLDFYADRTRRPGVMEAIDDAAYSMRVPRPVIRAIGVGLRRRAQELPDHARAASGALWEAEYRETRLLTCAILSGQEHGNVPHWALDWISPCDDRNVVAEMATAGLESWRRFDTARFLDQIAAWLGDANQKVRTFALLALGAAVDDGQFEDIPSVFRLIKGIVAVAKGDERRALRRLIDALVDRSPPEAARFLLDEISGVGQPAVKMARGTIERFPSRQRELLERTLSS